MSISGFTMTSAATAEAFRISPQDSNYFALLFDRATDGIGNVFVVEIFTVGGATPPNTHRHAHEFFYVLHGEGIALCDGREAAIKTGDAMLLHPGREHVVRNTGSGRLYTLTVMTPDEDFSTLIRSGQRVALDDEDRRVLGF